LHKKQSTQTVSAYTRCSSCTPLLPHPAIKLRTCDAASASPRACCSARACTSSTTAIVATKLSLSQFSRCSSALLAVRRDCNPASSMSRDRAAAAGSSPVKRR
jgi:hypothetical protein